MNELQLIFVARSEVESAAYDDATGAFKLGMSIDWEGK